MTFKPVDQGGDPRDVSNSQGKGLYKRVKIDWQTPIPIAREDKIELPGEYLDPGYLYLLVRNHGNSKERDRIVYVGITNSLKQRFANHPKVDEIRATPGSTSISIGKIDFGKHSRIPKSGDVHRLAIEELEHILIWTLWKDLWNDKKWFTLPGMGSNGGEAWHITNDGEKFSGRMPKRIVYPWILIEPRRNRTIKR
jgi:hypothetical protein